MKWTMDAYMKSHPKQSNTFRQEAETISKAIEMTLAEAMRLWRCNYDEVVIVSAQSM